jgi:hypothetical protein
MPLTGHFLLNRYSIELNMNDYRIVELAYQNPDLDMGLLLFFPLKNLTLRFISH